MGQNDPAMRVFEAFRARRRLPRLEPASWSVRPRDYVEWRTLSEWGELPEWELEPAGYLLRLAREEAGLTQAELAARLGVSQQAVSQAERWDANPTVGLLRRWAEACGADLKITIAPR